MTKKPFLEFYVGVQLNTFISTLPRIMAQILAYVTSLFQVLLIFIESTLDKALKYNAHKYPL